MLYTVLRLSESHEAPLTHREDASRGGGGAVDIWLRAQAPAEIFESQFWSLPVKKRWAGIQPAPNSQ